MISHPSGSASLFHANYVLAALNPAELSLVTPHLTPCLLHLGQTLYDKDNLVQTIYFLKTGVVSLVLTAARGVDVEVGMIGREGVVGSAEVAGDYGAAARAIVQVAGNGWRMPAHTFREEFLPGGPLQNAVMRASHSLFRQMTQCVLCNRLHSVEQRLARWLLMCEDRMHLPTIELTQEYIANMLGTRRVGVTLAAGILREAGLIEYSRGRVTIIDRPGLELRACECYAAIRASFTSLIPSLESPLLPLR